MVTPFLALLLARRRGARTRGAGDFFVVWVAVAVPQLLMQLGGGAGALAAFRIQWVGRCSGSVVVVLAQEFGLFIPLGLLAALGGSCHVPSGPCGRSCPCSWSANMFAFQPWDRDNHKILIYWFLMVAPRDRRRSSFGLWRAKSRGLAARKQVVAVDPGDDD